MNINIKTLLRSLRDKLPESTFFYVLSGLLTHVPGLLNYISEPCLANAPRYNYSVWLRHLVAAHKRGLRTIPETVAELGPGNSLAVGLAGLLSGANRLFALDMVNNTCVERNLEIFEHLVELFRHRERIPDDHEFPSLLPALDSYEFPSRILPEEKLKTLLSPARLDAIRAAISQKKNSGNIIIQYYCPWWNPEVIQPGTVGMVLSQYVLEHVDQLEKTYSTIYKWLIPGGISSHVVDYSCHNLAREWNGHWQYGDLTWRMIRGKKPYLLNRVPYSHHIDLIEANGLHIVDVEKNKALSNLRQKNLAPVFRNLSDDDITTRGAYIMSKKH